MGRVVQVSILGRGRPAIAANAFLRSYESVVYRFGDAFEIETPLFAHGLWRYLDSLGGRPDAVALLGTAGSMWDALWEALPEAVQLSEATLAWHEGLHRAALAQGVTAAMLDGASAPFNTLPFASGLSMDVIPDCRSEADIRTFCRILMSRLMPGDEVVLDITHGYRHLPVLAAFLATSLRWLRQVTVRDVYYGAMEMAERPAGRPSVAPVLNLGYAAALFARGAACATYDITGRYGALAPYFPEQAEDMLESDYYENLTQTARARRPATRLSQAFAAETPADPWLAAAAEKLSQEWRWTRNSQLHLRMLSQAENLFDHGEYFKCIAMLHEAFRLYVCKKVFSDYIEAENEAHRKSMQEKMNAWTAENISGERKALFDLLRKLRNVLMHNHHSSLRQAQQLVDDRDRMHAFLKEVFEAAREQFRE